MIRHQTSEPGPVAVASALAFLAGVLAPAIVLPVAVVALVALIALGIALAPRSRTGRH